MGNCPPTPPLSQHVISIALTAQELAINVFFLLDRFRLDNSD